MSMQKPLDRVGIRRARSLTATLLVGTPALLLFFCGPAAAVHVPDALDVDVLWEPHPGDGYLEFINPTEFPALIGLPFATPPGAIYTEEYTGYTLDTGLDIIERGDSDVTAGDRADFDWVQENRGCETGGVCFNPLPVNHPGLVGAMGWTVGSPEKSPHFDPGTGLPHAHSDEEIPPGPLPHLENDAYRRDFFAGVDVFSVISAQQDSDHDETGAISPRDSALDYVLDFGNTFTGLFSPGVPVKVWIPGWTAATSIDDYVARWIPAIPGLYNVVAIEPAFGPLHDEITEIDAIKAFVPEPSSGCLALVGLLLVACRRVLRPRAG